MNYVYMFCKCIEIELLAIMNTLAETKHWKCKWQNNFIRLEEVERRIL